MRRKFTTAVLVAFIWSSVFVPIADARGCRFACRPACFSCHVPVKAVVKEVVKQVVVTEFVAFPVYVALAAYVPQPAAPVVPLQPLAVVPQAIPPLVPPPVLAVPVAPVVPVDPCAAKIAPLLARLDALERDNALLRQRLLGQPEAPEKMPLPKGAQLPKGLGALHNRCAKCHETATAEKMGGGFVMFQDGQLVELSEKQALLAFKKVVKQEMPPKDEPKLNDTDGQEILKFFDEYKKK